jgi:predicted Ser/Thr protein kinase
VDPGTETFDAELAEVGAPGPRTEPTAPTEDETAGRVGRFVLLEVLGRGGMGAVYSAYDPELDRKVALKLVRRDRDSDTARERMVREARGLARIVHANVVTVHDVGVVSGRVFVVMELLAGQTLSEWVAASRPDSGAIIDAYAQAARGLAAVHEAGLVHRDFKPSNAIRRADGRVRVIDFGLVVAGGGDGEAVAGTPRYMAPEQKSGGAVGPAADQYSLCVSLAEALEGRALPRHVDAALTRGRAADPADRFAAMDDLVAELERRPGQRRRRALLTAAVVAAMGGAIAYGAAGGRQSPVCEGGGPAMAALWSPGAQRATAAALAGPDWSLVRPRIDAYTGAWADGHRAACLAHDRREQSAALYDKRVQCLERRRRELARAIELLSGARVADPVRLVAELSPVDLCSDTESLLSSSPLPADPARRARAVALQQRLDRNRASENAGLFDVAIAEADAIAKEAGTAGLGDQLAEARLQQGRASIGASERRAAVPPLRAAMVAALAAGEDTIAVEALARYVFAAGSAGEYATAAQLERDAELGRALLARAGDPPALGALLENNVGTAYLALDQTGRARERFEAAVAARPRAGGVELAAFPANLALTVEDPGRRAALFARTVDDLSTAVGADHPLTLTIRYMAGADRIDDQEARTALADVAEVYRARYPAQGAARAVVLHELAWIDAERGERAVAAASIEEAASLFAAAGRESNAQRSRAYAALWRGDAASAAGVFEELVGDLTADGGRWWVVQERADARLGLGLSRLALGQRRAAIAALEPAMTALAGLARSRTSAEHDRRLARARAALAAALPASDRRRRELLDAASAWFDRAGNQRSSAEIARQRAALAHDR